MGHMNSSGAPSKMKLNILYIGTDQQRTSTLNCYGNSFAHSPNLDRLARGGVRFTDAYTVSPVCSPSRTSILLGVHVPVHGIYENGMAPYRGGCTPYFDQLKKAGYHTALIGKTHFKPIPKTIDHLDDHSGNNNMRSATALAEDYLETYLVNQTMLWIDSVTPGARGAKDTGKPWFAYLSMVSPHPPNWVPPGPWAHVYDGVSLPPLNWRSGDIEALPYQTRMLLGMLGKETNDPPAFPGGKPNMSFIDQPVSVGAENPNGRYNYYAQAAYVDAQVGRMLDFLDERNLTNSTLVIFSSDHGSELWDHGIGNDKHNFLDASLRVPLLMRLPGVLQANSTQQFATTLDITATILGAAGAEIPADYQGFDLFSPMARGQSSPRRIGIASEYRAQAVVTPTWKLAFFPEQGEGRLWNRADDPNEQNNLFDSSDAVTSKARNGLMMALLRWRSLQDPLGYLQANFKPGASTATNAYNHTSHLRGVDAEMILQNDALRFESPLVDDFIV